MKKVFLNTLFLMLSIISLAQTSDISISVSDAETDGPLLGATVYFEELEKGAVTDFDGIATFTEIPNGNQTVKILYVGFKTIETTIEVGTKKEFSFKLESGGNELDEVVIQSSRSTRTVKKIPTRIEFIGAEELGEKAVMNPTNISMVLRESTGIQMQQTSLSSGNTNIRIQGLDGRYTQLLRDGFPLYGGFSSGLSILQIPPLDLQQFEIIKGSSSTLYGGGAIAGLINMVSKTPDEEPSLDIMKFTYTRPCIPISWAISGYRKFFLMCLLIFSWKHSLLLDLATLSQPGKIGTSSMTANGTSTSSKSSSISTSSTSTISS